MSGLQRPFAARRTTRGSYADKAHKLAAQDARQIITQEPLCVCYSKSRAPRAFGLPLSLQVSLPVSCRWAQQQFCPGVSPGFVRTKAQPCLAPAHAPAPISTLETLHPFASSRKTVSGTHSLLNGLPTTPCRFFAPTPDSLHAPHASPVCPSPATVPPLPCPLLPFSRAVPGETPSLPCVRRPSVACTSSAVAEARPPLPMSRAADQ